jgi:hypothetical protein
LCNQLNLISGVLCSNSRGKRSYIRRLLISIDGIHFRMIFGNGTIGRQSGVRDAGFSDMWIGSAPSDPAVYDQISIVRFFD